ncbi:MAG: hypothetical protein IJ895_01510, partial [Prevotella sp.]|nr:hypothetical protein [Prevotella sp.]
KGSIYLVYQSTNSGYAYYVRFTNQDVPEDILRAFGEATATSTADGLMGKEDKLKLDEIREIDITDYIGTDKVLPQGKGCVYYYSDMGVTPIGVERYILPTDRSGNIVDDESSQDNGLFYVVRLHRQFVPQERWAIVVWKNDGTYYGEYEYQSAPAALLRAMYGIQYIPIENYVRDTNSQLPLRREYIHTFGGKRIILDYICLSVSGNKIVMPPPEDGGIYAMDSAYFWVYYHSRGEDLPDGNSPFYVWRASGHYYGELTDTEIAALELAYHESLATRTHHGMMSAPDKIKLDAVNVLDINNFCRTGGKLPQGWENRNFFTKNGLPVEMRQWDNNSQKYMVFATLSLGDVEEKALGTAPMEYRNSYYVFIDDDNGQYEYLTTYGYSTVPIEIARAFHGEERSEAVTDIFSL